MSSALLIALSDAVHPESIGAAAAKLEIPRHQAAHALQLGIGAMSAALATKTRDRYAMQRVFELVIDRGCELANSAFLSLIFSGRTDAVGRTIARAVRARPELGLPFLGATAPIMLGVLGSYATESRSNAVGFSRWLAGARDDLLGATPPQLRPVLGIRSKRSPLKHRPSGARPARVLRPRVVRASIGWFASLVMLLLLLIAWSSGRSSSGACGDRQTARWSARRTSAISSSASNGLRR